MKEESTSSGDVLNQAAFQGPNITATRWQAQPLWDQRYKEQAASSSCTIAITRDGVAFIHSPRPRQEDAPATNTIINGNTSTDVDEIKADDEWLKEMRGWIMVMATLMVSITYGANLNPPGGYWQEDGKDGKTSHAAGEPIMQNKHPRRFFMFRLSNSVALALSLTTILVLMRRRAFHRTSSRNTVHALQLLTVGSIMSICLADGFSYRSNDFPKIYVAYLIVPFLFLSEFLVWSWSYFKSLMKPQAIHKWIGELWRSMCGKMVLIVLRLVIVVAILVLVYNHPNSSTLRHVAEFILLMIGVLLWLYGPHV